MRKRILGPVLAVLLTGALGSASPPPAPPECVEAAAWVKAHRGALPATLPELSRFSMTYRRAIYDALPADARAALWREHLRGFLGAGSPLTGEQRALVREALDRLPALTAPEAGRVEGRALWKRATEVLGRDLSVRVFATLGEAPAAAAGASAIPLCNCAFPGEPGDCRSGTECTANRCSFRNSGCGAFFNEPCIGFCALARAAKTAK